MGRVLGGGEDVGETLDIYRGGGIGGWVDNGLGPSRGGGVDWVKNSMYFNPPSN